MSDVQDRVILHVFASPSGPAGYLITGKLERFVDAVLAVVENDNRCPWTLAKTHAEDVVVCEQIARAVLATLITEQITSRIPSGTNPLSSAI